MMTGFFAVLSSPSLRIAPKLGASLLPGAREFQQEHRNGEEDDPVEGEDQENGGARFRPKARQDDRQAKHDRVALPTAETEHDGVGRRPQRST